jgi:uncharacterized phage protein gp47/JayE
MAVTQQQLALQMLAQLRVLDPSVSAEIGTPERKILDTIAQALSDSQVDLTQLSGALDIDSKYGANLDRFLALFGFGRQQAVRATGFIEFNRTTPSTLDTRIPSGTQIRTFNDENSPVDQYGNTINPIYETTFEVVLLAGQTNVSAPVQAVISGSTSNLEAGKYFEFVGTPVYGIAAEDGNVTNPTAITGGVDQEDDDQLKTRFKNTVFRNLAGTQDQYMALAVSTAFTTKVNVIGPVSRYREYIQVPEEDDSIGGNGSSAEYTSALSTIPYSKNIYDVVPNFISNGQTGTRQVFFREEVDWTLNTTPSTKNRGDSYRLRLTDADPLDNVTAFRPNVTFSNVYTGTDDNIVAIRPRDIVLFEHSYMSSESRNSYENNVMNAIDVFIDGGNIIAASTIVPSPGTSTTHAFTNNALSKYYDANYRRWSQPDVLPTDGNIFIPLFWQPVSGLPGEITITTTEASATYFLNEHYFFVEDVTTEHYGTVRARNGIEWIPGLNGALSSSDETRTGNALNDFPANTPIEINNYLYDQNIIDLQGLLEAQKQVTTDVLVHRAKLRYFKLDVTVMYANGANNAGVDEEIRASVQRYFNTQYFGNVIQLSDILSVIHNVPGVDNVRWTSDVPGGPDTARIYETNVNGTTRPGATSSTPLTYGNDFFLRDNELPSLATQVDTVGFDGGISDTTAAAQRQFSVQPGLIIRSRAQNTWTI